MAYRPYKQNGNKIVSDTGTGTGSERKKPSATKLRTLRSATALGNNGLNERLPRGSAAMRNSLAAANSSRASQPGNVTAAAKVNSNPLNKKMPNVSAINTIKASAKPKSAKTSAKVKTKISGNRRTVK